MQRVLINGLSIFTGGGYTVGREVLRHVALARPQWDVRMAVTRDHPIQRMLAEEDLPANASLHWAPAETLSRWARRRYEQGELAPWCDRSGVDAVLQLNGMLMPGLKAPTLAHFQDPYPFRPQAWESLRDRAVCILKRRACAHAVRNAAACGWTSEYLRDLICAAVRRRPKRSHVFYNGVPDDWLVRARGTLPPWEGRPQRIVTVSNVSPYKRQSLVIDALALVRAEPGLEQLEYVILGACTDAYRSQLLARADRLGLSGAVRVEGRVSDERVQKELTEARALVLMSVCESFGIPPIEAMTFGAPVIVADCCALPEVTGDAALTSPVDDAGALAKRIIGLLKDPALADRLRRAGAERAQRFNWATIGAKMADCLEEISHEGRRLPAAS